MRDIRDCSGPWKGTWVQRDVRGTMHAFRLEFRGNAIAGGGEDRDGRFTMQGEVSGDRVYLRKAYPWLFVHYNGLWNGSFVAGTSVIGPASHREHGTFEIWPEDEEEAFDAAVEETETREPQWA